MMKYFLALMMYVENLKKLLNLFQINPPPLGKLGAPPLRRRLVVESHSSNEIFSSHLFHTFEILLQKRF
jgi:hypothetical protein